VDRQGACRDGIVDVDPLTDVKPSANGLTTDSGPAVLGNAVIYKVQVPDVPGAGVGGPDSKYYSAN
jgi:hypothetical protein